tara:strand:+ start:71 stop:253 length:183 start_codon:yes stop_codon:yes gene_type:complete
MILEALAGLVLNVFMADNATGQTITRGILMADKIEGITQEGVKEETNQIIKDVILEQGEK